MDKLLIEDIVKKVRITLDENSVMNEYLKSDTDNIELDDIIRDKIQDALVYVMLNGDNIYTTIELKVQEAAQYKQTDGSGYIVLPPDFMKLGMLKLYTWNVPCCKVAEEGSAEAIKQGNIYTRGTASKPVCVKSTDSVGNKILKYYTAGMSNDGTSNYRDHRVERMTYVPYPSIESGEDGNYVNGDSKLLPAIVNRTAGIVCVTRGQTSSGDYFFKLADAYLGVAQ